ITATTAGNLNPTAATFATDVAAVYTQGTKQSITMYQGNPGEEKATDTYNFNFAGTQIKTVTHFNYTLDTLSSSVTYKNSNITATTAGNLNPTAATFATDVAAVYTQGTKQSITMYQGNPGEEKATDTYNFNFAGTQIKTVTHFNYTLDTLSSSVTYKNSNIPATTAGNFNPTAATFATDVAAVYTQGTKQSITMYQGNPGEEKATDTYNFDFAGTQIKTVTHFNYTLDTLSSSVTYKNSNITATTAGNLNPTAATFATDVAAVYTQGTTQSITMYQGNPGEEKATDTYNFNFAGTQIKTVTHFNYTLDTLSSSVTYKNSNITATTAGNLNPTAATFATDVAAVYTQGTKQSITMYQGNPGEEKATDTYNFNFAGTQIKTVTHFNYTLDTLS